MNPQTALEALLDDVDSGRPPVGALLTLGRVRQRRRRVLQAYVGVVAAVGVVAGAGVAVAVTSGGPGGIQAATDGARAGVLDVRVTSGLDTDLAAKLPPATGDPHALWDPRTSTLYYVSTMAYSSTCAPAGSAARSGGGDVTLELSGGDDGANGCTDDAGVVTVTITGLSARPTDLNVTEAAGDLTVPVGLSAALPTDLTCDTNELVNGSGGLLAEFPQGPDTPEELVAAASSADRPWVLSVGEGWELRPDGTAFARHTIVLGPNGYFFDGYQACTT